MAFVRTFTEVEMAVGDVGTGVVAVAGKMKRAELCQWLKRKTRKDVKIFCPRPPAENLVKQGLGNFTLLDEGIDTHSSSNIKTILGKWQTSERKSGPPNKTFPSYQSNAQVRKPLPAITYSPGRSTKHCRILEK
ncbi:uncharacterized protein [Triticum aestivum]|uniref:uncharacterized protein n=1 Tax=Triticum aestivum TaxID=4565 RepID=UPI001D01C070|nr:uncharacterized protein LOC123148407 [Triticum aestivum]